MSQQSPHFSPHSKSKANYKSTNLRKIGNYGISDVAIVSVHSEKTRMKKMIKIANYFSMNKSQELKIFGRYQKLTSALKQRPEK